MDASGARPGVKASIRTPVRKPPVAALCHARRTWPPPTLVSRLPGAGGAAAPTLNTTSLLGGAGAPFTNARTTRSTRRSARGPEARRRAHRQTAARRARTDSGLEHCALQARRPRMRPIETHRLAEDVARSALPSTTVRVKVLAAVTAPSLTVTVTSGIGLARGGHQRDAAIPARAAESDARRGQQQRVRRCRAQRQRTWRRIHIIDDDRMHSRHSTAGDEAFRNGQHRAELLPVAQDDDIGRVADVHVYAAIRAPGGDHLVVVPHGDVRRARHQMPLGPRIDASSRLQHVERNLV